MREGVRPEVGFIAPIEGMRGVAVAWVILFHYASLAADDPWVARLGEHRLLDAWVRNGYLGVDLFFLISGFLLTLPWFVHARKGIAAPSARAFYARRVRRIVPAYYLQLAFLFLVVMPLLHGATYWRSDLWVDLWNAAAHALFVHNTTPITSGSLGVNGALWTLAVEAQYYVLVPLLAPLFVRAPRATLAACALAAFLWHAGALHDLRALVAAVLELGSHWHWPESVVRRLLTMQLPEYLAHFALGIVAGRAWLDARHRPAVRGARIAGAIAALLAGAVLLWCITHGGVLGEYMWIATTIALAVLLLAAANGTGFLATHVLARGPLAFCGRVSYSAYLYHFPLLLLWSRYAAKEFPAWASFPAYLAIVFAIAWLSWRYVERMPLTRAHPARGSASPRPGP